VKRSRKVDFHGGFSTRAKAQRKARKLKNGFTVARRVKGEMRYLVMNRKIS